MTIFWPLFCWLLLLIQRLAQAVPLPLSKLGPLLAPFENGCLVTFEVIPEGRVVDTLPRLKLTKTATVSSLNECAFVCYQNFCSAAFFEQGQPTSRCHLQIGPGEVCNSRLQRHYSFRNAQRAVISCVRCNPTKPVTISRDAELPLGSATTPLPSPVQRLPSRAPIFQQILPFSSTTKQSPSPLPPAVNPFTLSPDKQTAPTPSPIIAVSSTLNPVKPIIRASVDDETQISELEEEKEEKKDEKSKEQKLKILDKGNEEGQKAEEKEEKEQFTKRNLEKIPLDLLKQDGEKWKIAIGNSSKEEEKQQNDAGNNEGQEMGKSNKSESEVNLPKKLFWTVFSLDLLAEMHARKAWNTKNGKEKVKEDKKVKKQKTPIETAKDLKEVPDKSDGKEAKGIVATATTTDIGQNNKNKENLAKRNLEVISMDLLKEGERGQSGDGIEAGVDELPKANSTTTTTETIRTSAEAEVKHKDQGDNQLQKREEELAPENVGHGGEEENSAEIIAKIEKRIQTKLSSTPLSVEINKTIADEPIRRKEDGSIEIHQHVTEKAKSEQEEERHIPKGEEEKAKRMSEEVFGRENTSENVRKEMKHEEAEEHREKTSVIQLASKTIAETPDTKATMQTSRMEEEEAGRKASEEEARKEDKKSKKHWKDEKIKRGSGEEKEEHPPEEGARHSGEERNSEEGRKEEEEKSIIPKEEDAVSKRKVREEEERWAKEHGFLSDGEEVSAEESKPRRSRAHAVNTEEQQSGGNGTASLVARSIDSQASPLLAKKGGGEAEVRPVPSTIKLENGCFITFQAEPLANRPANFTAPFELDLEVESVEVCAVRCYQDGCTGALYHAHNRTCVLAYEDRHFCSAAPIISRFKHLAQLSGVNPLWLHCVNCRPEVNRLTGELERASKAGRAPIGRPALDATRQSTSSIGPSSATDSTLHPSTTTKGTTATTTTTTTKTTQIGTSTLKEAPSTARIGSGGKEKLARDEEKSSQQSLLLLSTSSSSEAQRLTSPLPSSTIRQQRPAETSSQQPSTSTRGPSSTGTTLTITGHSQSADETTTTTLSPRKKAEAPKEAVNERHQPLDSEPKTIKLDHGCFVTFQAEPLAQRPANHKAPFELKLDVESVEVCAIRCYQDGCTGALFHADTRSCELSYEDKHFCSKAPIISKFAHLANLRSVNPLWIHCVNCRPEVNRKTGVLEDRRRQ